MSVHNDPPIPSGLDSGPVFEARRLGLPYARCIWSLQNTTRWSRGIILPSSTPPPQLRAIFAASPTSVTICAYSTAQRGRYLDVRDALGRIGVLDEHLDETDVGVQFERVAARLPGLERMHERVQVGRIVLPSVGA